MIRQTIKNEYICDECKTQWVMGMPFKICKDSNFLMHDIVIEFKSDYHFCSPTCFIKYIKSIMDEAIIDSHFISKKEFINEK